MRNIIIYIFSFTLVIILANLFYVKSGLYAQDIKNCGSELVYKLDSIINKNTLYFGESSNFTFSESDTNKKSISDLLSKKNSLLKILTISKGAIHAGNYKALIKRLPDSSTIKFIIITLNLRSFGINWIESNLETNLSRSNVMYSNLPPVLKKLSLSLKIYDNKELFKRKRSIQYHYKHDNFQLKKQPYTNVSDWDRNVFNDGIQDANNVKDQNLTNVACHFIKNYAFVIQENNPRIIDLDEIIRLCENKKIKLILNVLPENYERGGKLCGSDLVDLMEQNVNFLKNRYKSKTIFIDNLKKLPDSCFIDRDWPTEHYVFYGRNLVASSINEAFITQQ